VAEWHTDGRDWFPSKEYGIDINTGYCIGDMAVSINKSEGLANKETFTAVSITHR